MNSSHFPLALVFLTGCLFSVQAAEPTAAVKGAPVVTFSAGHETDPRDHGRPVVLIAAALGVPSQVFRDAFSHVTPAHGGERPEPAQVQANKRALMEALGPLGVTNERLDEVSNFYRYPPGRGGLWKVTPAEAVAVISAGKVTGVKITNPGAGYTTAPDVAVAGAPGVKVKATLHFDKDLATNGSISSLTLVK